MDTLKFKTNINCGSCVNSVKGFINEVEAIEKWDVETDNPDKILTVQGKNIDVATVISVVEEAGFDISLVITA